MAPEEHGVASPARAGAEALAAAEGYGRFTDMAAALG
jgi:hypothetical protein